MSESSEQQLRDADHHDQVCTIDVQILLSWFFETSDPAELQRQHLLDVA